MTEEEIKKLVELQRSYFYTGATRPVKTRIEHLKKLKDWVTAHEEDINKDPWRRPWQKLLSKVTCVKPV